MRKKSNWVTWLGVFVGVSVGCAVLTLTYIVVAHLNGPTNTVKQQGRSRFDEAHALILKEHFELRHGEKLAKFRADWKAEDLDLSTDERTDQAIADMIKSLGSDFDSFWVPAGRNMIRRVVDAGPNQRQPMLAQVPGVPPGVPPGHMGPPAHAGPALPAAPVMAAGALPANPGPVEIVHLGNDIWWLRLSTFSQSDSPDDLIELLAAALNRCREAKGLVIDLVDNGGGHLHVALALLEMLVPEGQLVITRERDGDNVMESVHTVEGQHRIIHRRLYRPDGTGTVQPDEVRARVPLILPASVPIAIVVNGHSASASEVLAASLQMNRKVVLIGKRTFGKGVFQHVHNLKGGRMMAVTGGEWRANRTAGVHRRGLPSDLDATPAVASYVFGDAAHMQQLQLAFTWLTAAEAQLPVIWRNHSVPPTKRLSADNWMLGPQLGTGQLSNTDGGYGRMRFLVVGLVGAVAIMVLFQLAVILVRGQVQREALREVNRMERRDKLLEQYRDACRFLGFSTGEEALENNSTIDPFPELTSRIREGTWPMIALKEVAEECMEGNVDKMEELATYTGGLAALVIAQLQAHLETEGLDPDVQSTGTAALVRAEEMKAMGDAETDGECYMQAIVEAVDGLQAVLPQAEVIEVLPDEVDLDLVEVLPDDAAEAAVDLPAPADGVDDAAAGSK